MPFSLFPLLPSVQKGFFRRDFEGVNAGTRISN
jgi:hypothetical protein